jgi:hypothetical protein
MKAWPVRIIIVGATAVAALTFCRASAPGFAAEDVPSAGAPLKSTDCVAATAPTISALRLDVPVTPDTGGADRPKAWEETFARLVNVAALSAIEGSSLHPGRAQATTTSNAVAFISDSVEVSLETPAESAIAH